MLYCVAHFNSFAEFLWNVRVEHQEVQTNGVEVVVEVMDHQEVEAETSECVVFVCSLEITDVIFLFLKSRSRYAVS